MSHEMSMPDPVLLPDQAVTMSIRVRPGNLTDINAIVAITNDAFMADAFFKKPEAVLRFSTDSAQSLLLSPNSVFLLATNDTKHSIQDEEKLNAENEVIWGSIHLNWDIELHEARTDSISPASSSKSKQSYFKVKGKFSAVSVPERFGKRGVGQALVRAAEHYMYQLSQHILSNASASLSDVKLPQFSFIASQPLEPVPKAIPSSTSEIGLDLSMEMGVINARQDLFPWYERQGYQQAGPILPNPPSLQALIADGFDIHCILMHKSLCSSL